MSKLGLLPIRYFPYTPFYTVSGGYRNLNAPEKCCMRCIHTPKVYHCNKDDLLVCDINLRCKHPDDYCLSFIKRKN